MTLTAGWQRSALRARGLADADAGYLHPRSAMKDKFGDKAWGKYGLVDAFNPTTGWVSTDTLGLDVGMTLLAAENLRTGNLWKWFMASRNAWGDAGVGAYRESLVIHAQKKSTPRSPPPCSGSCSCSAQPGRRTPGPPRTEYRLPQPQLVSPDIERRVNALLAKMTLERR